MERPSCKTYFAVLFDIDIEKNAHLIKEGAQCLPQDIGIFNKDEVERFIVERLDVVPKWDRHHFVIGYNEHYDVDVNKMIRVTLKGLFGKERELKELCERFSVTLMLEIVPYIVANTDEPTQILSLYKDIIALLYNSGAEVDMDYYII